MARLTLLRCFPIFFFATLIKASPEVNNAYLSVKSLNGLAEKISFMFNGLEAPDSGTKLIDYNRKVAKAMENIITEMSLYDLPPVNVGFLGKALRSESELEDFKNINHTVYSSMSEIENQYNSYKSLVSDLQTLNETLDIGKYFSSNISEAHLSMSEKLYHLATDQNIEDIKSFFQIVLFKLEYFLPKECTGEIHHTGYLVFETWRSFISSQLKAILIDSFAHDYGHNLTNSSSTGDRLWRIGTVLKKYHSYLKHAMVAVPGRIIENCDVKMLIRDYPNTNFVEMERLFQLAVIPAQNQEGRCMQNCDALHVERSYVDHCLGKISNCQNGPRFRFCPAPEGSSRRYEWIEKYRTMFAGKEVDHKYYGKNIEACSRKMESRESLASNSCFDCLCTCEENVYFSQKAIFIISTRMEIAELKRNMVITGVRFKKFRRILYTEIRQGQLMPGGHIKENSTEWKNVDTFNQKELQKLIEVTQDKELENFRGEKNMTPYEEFIIVGSNFKHVNLNDLQCPSENHVLTGVGLGVNRNVSVPGGRIALFIKCHPVNWKEGKILSRDGIDINDLSGKRQELIIGGIPPNKIQGVHSIRSTNKFVEIQISSKEDDAGQSVLPWFDGQQVATKKSVPLSGIGLYHRGAIDSGGFFAYRLISIDYSKFT